MKKINVVFEADGSLDGIDIIVRAPERNAEIEELIGRIASPKADSLPVTGGSGSLEMVPVSDIVLLSVAGKQVSVITENDRFTSNQPLNSIEDRLDPSKFIRISRYEIMNLSKVVRYDFTLGGTLRIELVGGMETWAARRCIPLIRKRLSGKE